MTTTAPTTAVSDAAAADRRAVRRVTAPIGAVAAAVAITLSVTGAHSVAEWIVEVAVELITGAALFTIVVPRGLRRASAGGRGIAMGVVGLVLLVPAFWSGLPLLLGAAAVLLGAAGRRADRGAGPAIASLVLGVLCVVGYAALYITDAVLNG